MGNCFSLKVKDELDYVTMDSDPGLYTSMSQSVMLSDKKATELISKLG
jgi:hypothetical protein